MFDTAKLETGQQDCELSIKRLCGDISMEYRLAKKYIYIYIWFCKFKGGLKHNHGLSNMSENR